MLKIAMSEISRLFDAIQAVDELYLPVEKGNEVECGLYSAAASTEIFFPSIWNFIRSSWNGKNISFADFTV